MLWNGFPNYISKALLHCLKSNVRNCDVINEINNNKENVVAEIFFRLTYAGSKGEQLVKHCLKKIRSCLKINVKFVVICNTKEISFYCNAKDKVPHEQRNKIYRITCPGCGGKYIGKTKRCLISRMNGHGIRDTEPMFKHLSECEMFKETCNLYAVPSLYNERDPNEISLFSV